MTSPQDIEALVKILAEENDPDAATPEARADALQQVWDAGEDALPALLGALSTTYVAYLTRAFSFLGDTAVPHLVEKLSSEDANTRANAAYILGKMGAESAFEPLLGRLADESEKVRKDAINALAAFRNQKMVPALLPLLNDDAADVRIACAATLGLQADVRAVEALNDIFLRDPDERVRRTAQEAMRKIGGRAQQENVDDMNPEVQARYAEALHKSTVPHEDSEVLFHTFGIPRYELLIATLESNDHNVQRRAVRELIKMGDKVVQPLIKSALSMQSPQVRAHIAFALGELKDERAKEVLGKLKADGDTDVSYAASQALSKLDGSKE